MENVTISIVCDVFNHEPYLRQCLDGFVMQKTDFPFEILIHDDASTDRSAEIIREYACKYPDLFKPIYQNENQYSKGVGIWRDIQFPRATGKYIAICEGDDYWIDPYKLQKQADFLESHPDFSMCCHGADVINQTSRKIDCACEYMTTREYFPDDAFPTWQIPTASIMYRREIVNNYKVVRQGDFFAGDVVLILKCMHVGRVWGFSDHMSVYRMNPGGATSAESTFEMKLNQCKHYEALIKNFPLIDRDYCDRYIAMAHYTNFRRNRNIKSLLIAMKHKPSYVLGKMLRLKIKPRNDLFYQRYQC